jgi:hypothetical protein
MATLAMHPADVLPIAGVILMWVALHRLRRRRAKRKD